MPIRRPRRSSPTLDMTPMIDCVFQLLIFFMLSSSMIAPQIKITLPQAKTKDDADNVEIVVSASAKGEFYVNQEPASVADLADRLRPMVERSKTKVVTFRGDKQLHYDLFLKALDASRQAGAQHLNVMHQ